MRLNSLVDCNKLLYRDGCKKYLRARDVCRVDSNYKLTSECSPGTDAANEQFDDVCKNAQAYIRQMEALQGAKMTALRNMESKLGCGSFRTMFRYIAMHIAQECAHSYHTFVRIYTRASTFSGCQHDEASFTRNYDH